MQGGEQVPTGGGGVKTGWGFKTGLGFKSRGTYAPGHPGDPEVRGWVSSQGLQVKAGMGFKTGWGFKTCPEAVCNEKVQKGAGVGF